MHAVKKEATEPPINARNITEDTSDFLSGQSEPIVQTYKLQVLINTEKELLRTAIRADKNWTGSWQISLCHSMAMGNLNRNKKAKPMTTKALKVAP